MNVRFGLIGLVAVVMLGGLTGTANAQNPTIQPNCAVQAVIMPPAATVWQIKGSGNVINLPATTTQVRLEVEFQKKPNGGQWAKMFNANQVVNAVNGTATFDTGFIGFTPAPAQGDQYRIRVGGDYTVPGPPVQNFQLTITVSLPVTPIP